MEEFERLCFNALGSVKHHDHRIHGCQHAVGVFAEITVTGSVQQVENKIAIGELQNRGRDRNATLAFHLHPV